MTPHSISAIEYSARFPSPSLWTKTVAHMIPRTNRIKMHIVQFIEVEKRKCGIPAKLG
jgi:hypothetical protein